MSKVSVLLLCSVLLLTGCMGYDRVTVSAGINAGMMKYRNEAHPYEDEEGDSEEDKIEFLSACFDYPGFSVSVSGFYENSSLGGVFTLDMGGARTRAEYIKEGVSEKDHVSIFLHRYFYGWLYSPELTLGKEVSYAFGLFMATIFENVKGVEGDSTNIGPEAGVSFNRLVSGKPGEGLYMKVGMSLALNADAFFIHTLTGDYGWKDGMDEYFFSERFALGMCYESDFAVYEITLRHDQYSSCIYTTYFTMSLAMEF